MPTGSTVSLAQPRGIGSQFARDVVAGLKAMPKRLPPKYFYDDEGCRLFERITEQPEYYLTRTELGLLRENAAAIASLFPPHAALVEFGTGTTTKVRILLSEAKSLTAYVPIDIAADCLEREAAAVRRDFPHLSVQPVTADFLQSFELPPDMNAIPKVGFFPGSTIGNLEPHEATLFLQRAGRVVGAGSVLIVGVDRVKDPQILNAAYNDAAGVTAAFNLNILTRINRELGANFRLECFEHHAFYNRTQHRIEMHLASLKRQKVRVDAETIDFRAGETIHTENSYKYTPDAFRALARGAGWTPIGLWTDAGALYCIHALRFEDR